MHFFKNSASFIAIMCVCGVAYSAPRVGVNNVASAALRRMPSLANVKSKAPVATVATTSTTSSSSSTVLLSDTDCIENYRDCMKGENACGAGFEECTTNVLFHGHMSECVSTLYQCSSSAINSLFGTSSITSLSDDPTYVADTHNTEVARYKYPLDSSIMGMDIIGAATRNKLSTADCVKKYKRCLNKDNICGEDFELCTSDDEFKKQAAMCDSTLSRCQKEGFQQLFGSGVTTKPSNKNLKPGVGNDGDVRQWIDAGATLAASNAVNTCYKVVDSCFTNACAKNPYRCVDGINVSVARTADAIAEGVVITRDDAGIVTDVQSANDVRKFFRGACEDTIGANKYCQMTFLGRVPTKAELNGEDREDLYNDIFTEAYTTRKNILNAKLQDAVAKFDTNAQNKCIDTFKSCTVNSCGGGSGAVCYVRVFGDNTTTNTGTGSINKNTNNSGVYSDIKNGCAGIVNTDPNCMYMAAVQGESTYSQTFSNDGVFGALFPLWTADGDENKPVVAALNSELSTAYNFAAIEGMKKQCQTLVENCAKSVCGKDFQNCYRNRTDIKLTTYNSGNAKFDNSMNKVGGVLDYTIVQGLCSSTIRNSETCAESLAIAKMNISDGNADVTAGWGNNVSTVTNAWRKSASLATADGMVNDVDANGKRRCVCDNNVVDICADEAGSTNMTCTKPHRVAKSSLLENQAVNTLFADILDLVEAEAQAQYKAKLTKEQNICIAQNSAAQPDATKPFVWASLGNAKIPSEYRSKGLGDAAKPSNDLYNSFCRVRVDLMSEDRDVQTLISGGSIKTADIRKTGLFGIDDLAKDDKGKTLTGDAKDSYAYFAAGDAFTCGSWLSEATINAISEKVARDARKEAGEGSHSDEATKRWVTIGSTVLGSVGSFALVDSLQRNGKSLGGLLNPNTTSNKNNTPSKEQKGYADRCVAEAREAQTVLAGISKTVTDPTQSNTALNDVRKKANTALNNAVLSGISVSGISFDDNNTASTTTGYEWNYENRQEAMDFFYDADKCNVIIAANAQKYADYVDENGNAKADANLSAFEREVNEYQRECKKHFRTIYNWLSKNKPTEDQALYTEAGKAYQQLKELNKKQKTGQEFITYWTPERGGSVFLAQDNLQGLVKGDTTTGWSSPQMLDTYKKNLTTLEEQCQARSNGYETDDDRKDRLGTNIAAALVGGAATTALANGIVSDVQQSRYEEAANDAVKEWMDNIGSKIHCYINGQMVGNFGDIITVSITED